MCGKRIFTSIIVGTLLGVGVVGCGGIEGEKIAEPQGDISEPQVQMAQPAESGMSATIQDNSTVQLNYTLTVDGDMVDSSEGRDPLRYVHGQGQIIPGLERQLSGLQVGDAREITVTPEEGYGVVNPAALVELPKEKLPKDVTPEVGASLVGTNASGRPFQAKISEIKEETVTLDLNHPLAGKTLVFNIEVVNVAPSQ